MIGYVKSGLFGVHFSKGEQEIETDGEQYFRNSNNIQDGEQGDKGPQGEPRSRWRCDRDNYISRTRWSFKEKLYS